MKGSDGDGDNRVTVSVNVWFNVSAKVTVDVSVDVSVNASGVTCEQPPAVSVPVSVHKAKLRTSAIGSD